MKQLIIYILLGFFAVISISACTNDEGGEDLDIVTPNDSTQARLNVRDL